MKFPTIPTPTIQIIKKTEDLDLSTHPVRHVVELTTPQRKVTLEQTQRTNGLPGKDGWKDKTKSNREMHKATQMGCSSCSTNFKVETPRLHSGAACDRQETIEIPKLPPFPEAEVVWQQPSEITTKQCNFKKTTNDSVIYYTQETSKTTVANQTSPLKGTQPQNYEVTTEHAPGKQRGNEPVPFFNCCKNCPTDIQDSKRHVTTTLIGDTTIPPLTTTTTLIEERLVRDE